jgi:lipopolysaccharide biosynthesis glycosyltransferase
VCIIESDMVIMKNIDAIFGLKAPAALTYLVGDRNVKYNDRVKNVEREVLEKCHDMGRINGGVMLIHPIVALFEEYKSKIVDVVQRECKYPNETLFEYVNREYYNLPIQYNLSHYLAKGQKLAEYRLSPSDIVVFHFNETKYKHIDIIKNPMDENGDNWLDIIRRDKKYDVKKLPILHYKTTVFDKYLAVVEPMMIEAVKKVALVKPDTSLSKDASLPKDASLSKDEIKKASPKDEIQPFATTNATPVASLTKDEIIEASPIATTNASSKSSVASITKDKTVKKPKKIKCPKGTRKNRRKGVCEPIKPSLYTPSLSSSLAAEPLVAQQLAAKLLERNLTEEAPLKDTKKPKKCPKGTRKNRRTGICEPVK